VAFLHFANQQYQYVTESKTGNFDFLRSHQ